MGIGLSDFVEPLGDFAVAKEEHLLGGYRSVADTTARDAIPDLRRNEGMLVFTRADGILWRLGAGLTNGDWVQHVSTVRVQDEGSNLNLRPAINFIGGGVSAADNSGQNRTDVTIPGVTVLDDGSSLTQRTAINFIGGGVSAADNPGQSRTDVTITGNVSVQDEGTTVGARPTVNFSGVGVTAVDNPGQNRVDVTVAGTVNVRDEGSSVGDRPSINFIGEGVTAVDNSGQNRIDVTIPGTVIVKDEGTTVGTRGTINFAGGGVTAIDNPGQNRVDITIAGGASSGAGEGDNGSALRVQGRGSIDHNGEDVGISLTGVVSGFEAITVLSELIITSVTLTGGNSEIRWYDPASRVNGVVEVASPGLTVTDLLAYSLGNQWRLVIVADDRLRIVTIVVAWPSSASPPLLTVGSVAEVTQTFGGKAALFGDYVLVTCPSTDEVRWFNRYDETDGIAATLAGSSAPDGIAVDGRGRVIVSTATGYTALTASGTLTLTPSETGSLAPNSTQLLYDGRYLWASRAAGIVVLDPTLTPMAAVTYAAGTSLGTAPLRRMAFDGTSIWTYDQANLARLTLENGVVHRDTVGNDSVGKGLGVAVNEAGDVLAAVLEEPIEVESFDQDVLGANYILGFTRINDVNYTVASGINNVLSSAQTDLSGGVVSEPSLVNRMWAKIVVNSPTSNGTVFDLSLLVNGSPEYTTQFTETGTGTFYVDVDPNYVKSNNNSDDLDLRIEKNPPATDPMDWDIEFGFAWYPRDLISHGAQTTTPISVSTNLPSESQIFATRMIVTIDVNTPTTGNDNYDIVFVVNGTDEVTFNWTEVAGTTTLPITLNEVVPPGATTHIEVRNTGAPEDPIDWTSFDTIVEYYVTTTSFNEGNTLGSDGTITNVRLQYTVEQASASTGFRWDLYTNGVQQTGSNFTEAAPGVLTVLDFPVSVPILATDEVYVLLSKQTPSTASKLTWQTGGFFELTNTVTPFLSTKIIRGKAKAPGPVLRGDRLVLSWGHKGLAGFSNGELIPFDFPSRSEEALGQTRIQIVEPTISTFSDFGAIAAPSGTGRLRRAIPFKNRILITDKTGETYLRSYSSLTLRYHDQSSANIVGSVPDLGSLVPVGDNNGGVAMAFIASSTSAVMGRVKMDPDTSSAGEVAVTTFETTASPVSFGRVQGVAVPRHFAGIEDDKIDVYTIGTNGTLYQVQDVTGTFPFTATSVVTVPNAVTMQSEWGFNLVAAPRRMNEGALTTVLYWLSPQSGVNSFSDLMMFDVRGTTVRSLGGTGFLMRSLVHDGHYLWAPEHDGDGSSIIRMDPFSGSTLGSPLIFSPVHGTTSRLAWDGRYIWVYGAPSTINNPNSHNVAKIDPQLNSIVGRFSIEGGAHVHSLLPLNQGPGGSDSLLAVTANGLHYIYAPKNASLDGLTTRRGHVYGVQDVTAANYAARHDDHILAVRLSSAPITIDLDTVGLRKGRIIEILDANGLAATHTITIDATSTGGINGANSLALVIDYAAIRLMYNGTGWNII